MQDRCSIPMASISSVTARATTMVVSLPGIVIDEISNHRKYRWSRGEQANQMYQLCRS
jgi:hypothetical protein